MSLSELAAISISLRFKSLANRWAMAQKGRSDAIQMEFMAKLCVRHKYARHTHTYIERERDGEEERQKRIVRFTLIVRNRFISFRFVSLSHDK